MIWDNLYRMARERDRIRRGFRRFYAWAIIVVGVTLLVVLTGWLAGHFLFGLKIIDPSTGGPATGWRPFVALAPPLGMAALAILGGVLWVNHLDSDRD